MACYGYARVSTALQADEGESLEVQRRKIEGRALELGVTLDHVYVERGVSGSRPLEQRPQGKLLLAALKPGDTVIASKLDRMFRSASDALRVLETLKRQRVSLVLLDMGGDVTGDGITKLVFTILSAVATFERERLQERIREGKAHQRDQGVHLGGSRPFGYTVGAGGTLEPVADEQRAIKDMLTLKDQGRSLRVIAATVGKHHGLRVSHATVQRVLRDAARP
jgi:putative DNA-invertase from lambdoid prophage Rac